MSNPVDGTSRLRGGASVTNKAKSESNTGATNSADSTTPRPASDVEITSQSTLQEIESRIAELPIVDKAKVEGIKQAIANGDYQIDADAIAKKLVEVEKLLS